MGATDGSDGEEKESRNRTCGGYTSLWQLPPMPRSRLSRWFSQTAISSLRDWGSQHTTGRGNWPKPVQERKGAETELRRKPVHSSALVGALESTAWKADGHEGRGQPGGGSGNAARAKKKAAAGKTAGDLLQRNTESFSFQNPSFRQANHGLWMGHRRICATQICLCAVVRDAIFPVTLLLSR